MKKTSLPRNFTFILILFLSFIILQATKTALSATIDQQIAEQKKALEQVNKQIQQHARELAQAEKKEKSYLRELSVYDSRVQQTQEQIALLDLEIQKNKKELEQVSAEITKQNARIKSLQETLAERCVAIYKWGEAAEINLLLSANDLTELNNLTYLMNRLSREDEKNIEALETEKLELKSNELKLQQASEELASRIKLRERDLVSQKQAVASRREIISQIEQEKQAHQAAMKESEEAQKDLQKKIDDYIRKKAAAAAAAKKEKTAKGQPADKKPTPEHKGKFDWPVPERQITSRYGTRIHPKFKTKRQHTGIDIGSPEGTPIKAADAGEVIFAGLMRGYGQVIIIDHGGGFATVYAHMSKMLVEEGATVKKGTVIGNVGHTGVATGPHLHFEVRVNGTATDPMKYL